MTAEFAAVLPAVVLVLGIALAAMQLAGEELRLQGAVADAARLLGRGSSGALALVRQVAPDARLAVSRRGSLVCAQASGFTSLGILLTASACALDDAEAGETE